ncbi:MAG: efflux RND transporter permease subunit [Burkholderiaceae bacterium]
MNLPELCIRRPVMTTLLMAAFVVFGALAYFKLPVSELPAVDFPTISVTAELPGASPETMASSVATPLEGQFSTIAGLASMGSISAQGRTSITLTFELDRDVDAAAQDVQSAISSAAPRLPSDLPNPPRMRKLNPAESPIFYLAMGSDTLPLSAVNEYAETQLAQRLSTISGVAQVLVYGSQRYAVRVQVDPNRLAARGIGIDEVRQAITQANVNKPTGELEGARQSLALRANGQLERAAQYRDIAVVYRNGTAVRLADVADVVDSVENLRVGAWFDGKRSIILAIQRQPGSNTVAVVEAVRRELPSFQAKLPPAIRMGVLYDRSESIRDSIDDVRKTLIEAGVLVVLVIFLFLRNLSATVIPAIALPISVIGTFAAMHALGFGLDNLSLLALTLSVGFVVDDAIVMLENIVRHIEARKSPMRAALDGSREVGFTIISMTLSLVAVFIPVMFMGGIVGRLLHEFAVTISCAILVSALVSLTLTPMMCSRYLRGHGQSGQHGLLFRLFERSFEAMRAGYRVTLDWALRFHLVVALLFLVTTGLAVWLYTLVPKEFLPPGDSGRLIAYTVGGEDTSFAAMAERQRQVAEIVATDPNVVGVNSIVGAGGSRPTSNNGLMFIRLRAFDERIARPNEVIQQLRRKTAGVPGIRVVFQNPPPIRLARRLTQAQYQYTLQGADLEELYDWSNRLLNRLRAEPLLQDVVTNLNNNSPTIAVRIDRDRLAQVGLSFGQVQEALASAFSSRQVSTIYGAAAQYQVILEVARQFQADPSALSQLYVRSSTGRLVPLDAVARFSRESQALTVNHQGQLPSVTLSFNLPAGVALGQAVDRIREVERQMQMPATVVGSFEGAAQAFEESLRGLGILLFVAVLVIYIVLGILYESFIHPLTILSGLPSAGLGALLTLLVFGIDLSLYAFVGIIMLIGIVKKNAIMMIDFAIERERAGGVTPFEAIREACLIRFRPIMMTTFAALAGTLPIALGTGAGGETRVPLGMAVVGGLVVSQVLTLYLTPVVYLYLDRLSRWLRPAAPTPEPGTDVDRAIGHPSARATPSTDS